MSMTAHRAVDHVKEVRVSAGTRSMAVPCSHEVPTLMQEWDELLIEINEINARLQDYTKAAFTKEQMRIRNLSGNTLKMWLERKMQLEDQRKKLVEQKMLVESRMCAIKDKVKEERRKISLVQDPRGQIFDAMLIELRAIRKLLEYRQGAAETKGGEL